MNKEIVNENLLNFVERKLDDLSDKAKEMTLEINALKETIHDLKNKSTEEFVDTFLDRLDIKDMREHKSVESLLAELDDFTDNFFRGIDND